MATELLLARERIIQNPAILDGKPIVKDTRIPVERVLAHLAHVPDLADLLAAYPELTVEDVCACLEFARGAVAYTTVRTSGSMSAG